MVFLVDGYNAIRRVDRLRRVEERDGLEAGREALISAVLASGVLNKSKVIVLFDGRGDVYGPSMRAHPALTVRFSKAPQNADQAILSLLERKSSSERTVVTADQELAFAARAAGASVIAPAEWDALRAWDRRKRGKKPSETMDKPKATSDDVRYWLKIFGDET